MVNGLYRSYHDFNYRILLEENIDDIQGEFSDDARKNCFYEGWKSKSGIDHIKYSSGLKTLGSPLNHVPKEIPEDYYYKRGNYTISDAINLINEKVVEIKSELRKTLNTLGAGVLIIWIVYGIVDFLF